MAESIVSVDTVTVTGGPSTVNVDVDFGPQGDRGSLILYGLGEPTLANLPQTAQLLDWYINLEPNDPYYLWIYQYVSKGNQNVWDRIFNIVPNTFHKTMLIDFVNGMATDGVNNFITLNINNTTLPLVPAQNLLGLDLNISVMIEPTELTEEIPLPQPVSIGIKRLLPDIVGDEVVLPLVITAIEAAQVSNEIVWAPVSGTRTAHITINVVGTEETGS